MDTNLQELQLKSVTEMLQLSVDDDSDVQNIKTWKMLIYDDESRRILSPIVKIGDLRRQGVTLNLSINDKRDAILGVDVVYLIEPTEDNVNKIIEDAKEKRYNKIHINFTTFTSDDYLGELAKKFVEQNAFSVVSSVTDRYIHFISLSPLVFSLNMPECFKTFYGNVTEEAASLQLDILVERLLSVIVTLGSLPIIKSPKINSPASTVAEKLNKKLYDLISTRNQLGIILSSTYNRPVLVLLNRNIDIGSMIQHSWNYQPLLHDLFGIDYNKVSITTQTQKRTTFDLESSDKIYDAILNMPLSDVALYISSALESYNTQISQISRVAKFFCRDLREVVDPARDWTIHGGMSFLTSGDSASTGDLVNAINAIPQLTEQKRLLDMHTNIATSLVDVVKGREIDRFYEFEYDLDIMYDKNCLQKFEELLSIPSARPMDKYRTLLLMALSKGSITEDRLVEFERRIKADTNFECDALKGLKNILKMKDFSTNILQHIQTAVTTDQNIQTSKKEPSQSHKRLANYSSKLLDTGLNLFKGVRNLLPRKKLFDVVNIAEKLINMDESISDEFVTYDPKVSEILPIKSNKKLATKKYIIFIVGGGSYNEALATNELSNKLKHTIIYGSTFFDRPEDFVNQLGTLNFSV